MKINFCFVLLGLICSLSASAGYVCRTYCHQEFHQILEKQSSSIVSTEWKAACEAIGGTALSLLPGSAFCVRDYTHTSFGISFKQNKRFARLSSIEKCASSLLQSDYETYIAKSSVATDEIDCDK